VGEEEVRVGPGHELSRITSYPPAVHVMQWEGIATEGRVRRRTLVVSGVLGAGLVLLDAGSTGQWGLHLSAAGIILDIAGAALLATGLMLPAWASKEMATPRYGESKSVRTYWEQASRDAKVAFVLLVAGFLMQGVAMVFANR
jgi:hypothetical protein